MAKKKEKPVYRVNQFRLGADLLQVEALIMLARAAMFRHEHPATVKAIMDARELLGSITVAMVHPATSEYFLAVEPAKSTERAGER